MPKRKRERNPSKQSIKKSKKSKKSESQKEETPSQDTIAVEKLRVPCHRREEFHDTFLNYDQIKTFLLKVQKEHPGSVTVAVIGHSKEDKPICMVQITSVNTTDTPKHVTFIEAGLNGEDVYAVSSCLHIIDYLSKNANCVRLMDYFICPCGNPDAYDKFIQSKTKPGEEAGTNQKNKANKKDTDKKCPKKMKDGEEDDNCAKINSNKEDSASKSSKTDATEKCGNKNNSKNVDDSSSEAKEDDVGKDLSNNFPVVLGMNDMSNIPTPMFLEKIQIWKENYTKDSPETIALLSAINSYQFAIKLLISLHDGGESICYPYGFIPESDQEYLDLQEVAKKGKCAIVNRNFQYGSYYDIRGMTYGTLMDFLKIDKSSIKYLYAIQVHAKPKKDDEKQENLRSLGGQIMECIKKMSCSVYKFYTNMTGNKEVELVRTKPGLVRKRSF